MSILDWLPWMRERRTNELADEMRVHLEMAESDRMARGESPHEAAGMGAAQSDVMRMVMRQGEKLALVGVALGLIGATIVSRALAGLVVGVKFADPVSFGIASVLLTLVALAGCYLPARRAIRVDPVVVLRG